MVPEATVEIESVTTHVHRSAKTNDEGLYILQLVQPGIYRLSVTAQGFEPKLIENIRFEVGAKVTVNITLAVGAASQSVTVNSSGINVNTTDASVSTVVDRTLVENIPLNGRSFQSLLTVVPGVSLVPAMRIPGDANGAFQ